MSESFVPAPEPLLPAHVLVVEDSPTNLQIVLHLLESEATLTHVNALSGPVPFHAHRKKIRDDRGFRQQVETCIRDQPGAAFTHGPCPPA